MQVERVCATGAILYLNYWFIEDRYWECFRYFFPAYSEWPPMYLLKSWEISLWVINGQTRCFRENNIFSKTATLTKFLDEDILKVLAGPRSASQWYVLRARLFTALSISMCLQPTKTLATKIPAAYFRNRYDAVTSWPLPISRWFPVHNQCTA